MRIAIVGGGIADSIAAMLLSDKGHNVALYESRKYTGSNNYSRTGGIIGIPELRRALLPIVDVDIPVRAVFNNGRAVLLGDALANVRPHSAMGANLGIIGAGSLADNVESLSTYESSTIERLTKQILRGQCLGRMSGLGIREEGK
ncbi:MAG: NAD(P)-binding protein [Thermodesulfobacteriota bacterium]